MNRRPLRHLILGTLLTASSLGHSYAGAESPDAVPSPTPTGVTTVAKSTVVQPQQNFEFLRVLSEWFLAPSTAPKAGAALHGLGASLWQFVETFAMVEPARVTPSLESGSAVVSSGAPMAREGQEHRAFTFSPVPFTFSPVAFTFSPVAFPSMNCTPPLLCTPVGGSPMIVTLDLATSKIDEEYCPYDLDPSDWLESQFAQSQAADFGLAGSDLADVSSPTEVAGSVTGGMPWVPEKLLAGLPRFDRPLCVRGGRHRDDWSPMAPEAVIRRGVTAATLARDPADKLLQQLAEALESRALRLAQVSGSIQPRNWGPQLYELTRRGEETLRVATDSVVRRWPAQPQPPANVAKPRQPAVGAGERLLARAGAIAAAAIPDAEAVPEVIIVQELAIAPEADAAPALDVGGLELLSAAKEWWSMATSYGRSLGRIALLPDAGSGPAGSGPAGSGPAASGPAGSGPAESGLR